MPGVKNIIGKKFTRIIVIKYLYSNKNKKRIYLCRCDCGIEKNIIGADLLNGTTKSCGCLFLESLKKRSRVHYLSNTYEYKAWANMKTRCLNKKGIQYKDYGGRGISIDKNWKNSFLNFYKDMGPRPTNKHTLDRINNNKGYYKNNCRWTTMEVQNCNQRRNKYLSYKGMRKTISEWAKFLKLSDGTIRARINYGFSIDKILSPNLLIRTRGKK